jgi:acyl-CoA thioester hydrolase
LFKNCAVFIRVLNKDLGSQDKSIMQPIGRTGTSASCRLVFLQKNLKDKLMTHYTEIRTRYNESDQGGLIHHSAYLPYLEIARVEFFETMGFDLLAFEQEGCFCVVHAVDSRYLKPLRALDEIKVITCLASYQRVKFSFSYEITKDGNVVFAAETRHCFVDAQLKPMAIPEKLRLQLDAVASNEKDR